MGGVFVVVASASIAATPFKVDPAAAAAHKEKVLRRTGGYVTRQGKGYVAFVNKQSRVGGSELVTVAEAIMKYAHMNYRVVDDELEVKDAALVVRVLDEPGKPTLLVAPESWWAEVNVAGLAEGLVDDAAIKKFLPSRVRKEVMRAFVYAAGSGGSSFTGNILDVIDVKDLDYLPESLPVDALDMAIDHLCKRGVTQTEQVSYRIACREGWAAAPTNDLQKAVWDDVHALPTEPIKIKFDPKRDK